MIHILPSNKQIRSWHYYNTTIVIKSHKFHVILPRSHSEPIPNQHHVSYLPLSMNDHRWSPEMESPSPLPHRENTHHNATFSDRRPAWGRERMNEPRPPQAPHPLVQYGVHVISATKARLGCAEE